METDLAHKHTHTPTPQPGIAGRSRNPSTSTHTDTAHPSLEWQGTDGARLATHTHPNTPARSGWGQPKPEFKHTPPQGTAPPGVAGYRRSVHTNTDTAQRPSQEWRGAAETRAQTHTPTPQGGARSGRVQAKQAHKHTHTPTPQLGVAGRSRNPSPSTHPTPHNPARSGRVQAERTHKHTQTPTSQPGVAGGSRNPSPSTDTHTARPGQEWQGTSGARSQTNTHPNTAARSGGPQLKPEPEHTHPHHTPQPGVAGYKRSADTNTHTPQHPSKQRRAAAETRAGAQPPTPDTPARSGGVQAERANKHIHPPLKTSQEWRGAPEMQAQAHTPTAHTPARSGGVQAEHAHKHTNTPTAQPGMAGRSRNPSPNTHTQIAHPSQEWRGTSGARTQPHTHRNTQARRCGAKPKPEPKHTHPHQPPQPGVAGYKRSALTNTHTPQTRQPGVAERS